MEKHVSLSGLLLITYGILHVLFLFIVFMLFLLPSGHYFHIFSYNRTGLDIPFVPIIFGLFIVFSILGIVTIIAGIGIMKFKEWARILAVISSILMLLNIPIGTFIGVYTLWVLLQKETVTLFNIK